METAGEEEEEFVRDRNGKLSSTNLTCRETYKRLEVGS